MEARFFDNLSPEVKALVTEIEDYAKKPINVAKHDRPKPSCVLCEFETSIFFPDLAVIDPAAMVHELLHIQRNWPQKIPQLFATKRDSQDEVQKAGTLDNQLEHLVIVPRQKLFGFDATDQWNRRYVGVLKSEFWKSQDSRNRRLNVLLTSLTVHFLVTDPTVHAAMVTILAEENLVDDAAKLIDEIKVDVTNKERVVSAVVRHFPIPRADIQLLLFDPVAEKEVPIPIPL